MICSYCSKEAKVVKGHVIYPHKRDLHNRFFYQCAPCEAYVGCHEGKKLIPFGRLANKELRKLKMDAHAAFDQIWKSGKVPRNEAYNWLSTKMKIKRAETHIGMFNEDQCRQVIEIVNAE